MTFREHLTNYINAGFPILWVTTHEEARVEGEIQSVAKALLPARPVYRWTVTQGWQGPKGMASPQKGVSPPIKGLTEIMGIPLPEESVLILRDFHPYLKEPGIVRQIRDLLPVLKSTGRFLLLLSAQTQIPPELEKEIQVLPFSLPSRGELETILTAVVEAVGEAKAKVGDKIALLESARGLTASEAENAFSLALVTHKALGDEAIRTVQVEKAAAVRKSGILEYFEPMVDLTKVGGLAGFKEWLRKRGKAFSDEARAFGLRPPKGVLVVGVPGGGKSYTAKAVSSSWKIPLLKLDLGKVFAKHVGESESRMREALDLAEAVAPCVLWVDEIDKGASGLASSGSTDSGVTARVIGTLLTWLSDKTSSVFVYATANDVSKLPAELLRKGRFDEIFAVDLPTMEERVEIFTVQLKRLDPPRDPAAFDLPALAAAADQFTGSEIEVAIQEGLFDAYDAKTELNTKHLLAAIEATNPLARTTPERIEEIRNWARQHARSATTGLTEQGAAAKPTKKRRVGGLGAVMGENE